MYQIIGEGLLGIGIASIAYAVLCSVAYNICKNIPRPQEETTITLLPNQLGKQATPAFIAGMVILLAKFLFF